MSNKENETKICRICGRELPIDFFLIRTDTKTRRSECPDCRKKLCNEYYKKHQQLITFPDDFPIIFDRKYKKIGQERILDIQKLGFEPCADDEIFVRPADALDFYISNYGRAIKYSKGKYSFAQRSRDISGTPAYIIKMEVYENGKYIPKKFEKKAATLVVQEFVVNPDCTNNIYIWHKGNDRQNLYYKDLYPLNQSQYKTLIHYFKQTGKDDEKFILQLMNDPEHMPYRWREKWTEPTVLGIGYIGCGDLDAKSVSYSRWNSMMNRCYNVVLQDKYYPDYKDCEICEEWWNYANYRKWFDEHVPDVGKNEIGNYHVDKDILYHGNRMYSASTCCIVPHFINTLAKDNKSGKYMNGVSKEGNRYTTGIYYCGKRTRLGSYETEEEAFKVYKEYKEKFIKDIAKKNNNKLPVAVQRALQDWQINP